MPARTLLVLGAVLGFAAHAAHDPAAWQPWIEDAGAPVTAPDPLFPDAAALAKLRTNRAWLERWSVAPSLAWSDVVHELVVKYQQNPLRAQRNHTYVHAAIHDALVFCARCGCDEKVRPVAMHAAASRVLDFLYPDESRGRLEAMGHSAAAAVLARIGDHPQASIAWRTGQQVAANAVRRAYDDGWDLPRLPAKRPEWQPGVWRASPPLRMYDPAEPHAGRWRTWVLEHGWEIEPPPPIVYGSAAFWAEIEEVREVAAALTPEQKRIAEDWNLDLGSVTPGGMWNLHAKKLVVQDRFGTADAARVFAALNAAMMDAFIACWQAKFKWWTERPVTVIREKLDPGFMPHVITPAFPSYVSGHSAASGAAAEVLAAFFPAHAAELRRMALEASMSRLYGGIHYRSDNEEGLALGRRVGARAVARAQSPAVTR
ncbi:MAG: vanadium-dependent haloperoxidase [Phycisphaeraceae bacterium]